ncbi:Pentatricopeptide repeat-containing protein [Thalictrum thalictroides]|uniref:riboflavin kinase n=1 Tax=Thalictrum thalictroides TaxID=46969 RepID=A0A7J6V6N2_THATH|nr:Pentatricopeptide repeat-containing protein [Thalictrum thalictroides]
MVMSIGWNPYFNNTEKTMEPWLLHDFSEDFYGEELRLAIVGYIRPEANFPSLESLISKIHEDRKIAENALDLPLGKPWATQRLSPQGQLTLHTLLNSNTEDIRIDEILHKLIQQHEFESEFDLETLSVDLLSIVKGLGFHKKCELALNIIKWIRNHKDSEFLLKGPVVAVLITSLGKENMVSDAASLLHSLHSDGFTVDVYAYTSMITAYANNGRYREAVLVFKKMEEEGCQPTLITYNVILNVYGKMGMPWNKIIAIVEGMKSQRIKPDSYTYNTLISCCKRGSLYEEAAEIFEQMKIAGFTPDKVTYNALLDVYGKSRRPKEAMEVLREMELNEFSPSIVTYNALISAYAKDGLLNEAVELKTQMVEKGIKPDVVTYTTLLSGFEKAGKDKSALSIFEEMRSIGCNPNICTYNALIKMYGNRGKFTEMMKIFEELRAAGCTPDIVTWNTLLAVFGQNGMHSEVSGVFKEMKKAGFVPERDTFNTLIGAYSRCRSFDQAMTVYQRMLAAGVTPDLSTYNAVLAALARGGLWKQAEKVLAEMKDGSRCKPNELTYSSLLHAYANGKEIQRMCNLSEEIYCGYSPDISTLNAMVSIYGKRQMVAKATEILNYMKETGFTPSLTTYNSLIYMYSRTESFERSEDMLREIKAKGLKPDLISYNTVIFAYGRKGHMQDASRIFLELAGSGLRPDVITYNTFVASYAAQSMFAEAIDVIQYMIKHGCRPNQNTYNAIVDWYCKHGRKDEAKLFVEDLRTHRWNEFSNNSWSILRRHNQRQKLCNLASFSNRWITLQNGSSKTWEFDVFECISSRDTWVPHHKRLTIGNVRSELQIVKDGAFSGKLGWDCVVKANYGVPEAEAFEATSYHLKIVQARRLH